MDYPDPTDFLAVKFLSTSSTNDTGYSNPEVDRLLEAAHLEPDRNRRLALYHQVEEIVFDDCPWIWHFHDQIVEVVQPYVKNYQYQPVYQRDYRETWLDQPATTLVTP
jgi:peptide/nickel transport system substrate-binding protein